MQTQQSGGPESSESGGFVKLPGLVNIQKAIENGHRNSEFSH